MLTQDSDLSAHSSGDAKKQTVRDEDILLRICRSGDRGMAAKALPGIGTVTLHSLHLIPVLGETPQFAIFSLPTLQLLI
jgi:hypothetical protein